MFEVLHNQDGSQVIGIDNVKRYNKLRRESGLFEEVYKYIKK
jgi:hypothetical protein